MASPTPGINSRRAAKAIQSIFVSGLATKFDEIDTAYASDDVTNYGAAITLNDIVHYYQSRLGQYDAYPCCALFPAGAQGKDGEGGGGFLIRDPRIRCVFYEITNDAVGDLQPGEVMELRLERMIEGASHLLHENRSLSVTGAKVAEITDILPPDFLDFEFSEGDTSLVRRSAAFDVICIVK